MDVGTLAQRVLKQAVAKLGSPEQLAAHLAVPPASVAAWLSGQESPPTEAVLRAVDLIISGNGEPRP
jgi:DNA-binding transcriptional regulator YdaS (Cro superfamily)